MLTTTDRAVVAAARDVAELHGLVLDGAVMRDRRGLVMGGGEFNALVEAYLAGAAVAIQGEFDESEHPREGGRLVEKGDDEQTAPSKERTDDHLSTLRDAATASRQAAVTIRNARSAVHRLTKLRGQTGTRLNAMGEQAYAQALRQAGARVKGRAQSRLSATRRKQVAAAVDAYEPLGAWLSAVGITELEVLRGSFDVLAEQATVELDRYWHRARAVIAGSGFDTDRYTAHVDDAVAYLVAGWTALARARLLLGDQALLAVARARLAAPHRGFDLPGIPDLALRARGAALARFTIIVAEGAGTVRHGSTPDEIPEVIPTAHPSLEVAFALDAGLLQPPAQVAAPRTVTVGDTTVVVNESWKDYRAGDDATARGALWRWVHGFYGEPLTIFEPHSALDGFETTDDADAALVNSESFPDADFFFPGDHDGCTCEWELAV